MSFMKETINFTFHFVLCFFVWWSRDSTTRHLFFVCGFFVHFCSFHKIHKKGGPFVKRQKKAWKKKRNTKARQKLRQPLKRLPQLWLPQCFGGSKTVFWRRQNSVKFKTNSKRMFLVYTVNGNFKCYNLWFWYKKKWYGKNVIVIE